MKRIRHNLIFIGIATGCIAAAGAQADMVTSAGFGTMVSTTGTLPTGYGYWQCDMSNIVHLENGIVPCEGACMLRFDSTTRFGPAYTIGSELW